MGPKTASCVLLFGMGRAEFPVDTHVWQVDEARERPPARPWIWMAYKDVPLVTPQEDLPVAEVGAVQGDARGDVPSPE